MTARLSHGARLLLDYAINWRKRHRYVNPAVPQLAEKFGCDERTIQRWGAELTRAGQLLRVYNGGQGRGRACIWYVGAIAVARAREEYPLWDERQEVRAEAKKPALGSLRMGKVALQIRTRKGDQNVTLNPIHSSSVEGILPSEVSPIGEPGAHDVTPALASSSSSATPSASSPSSSALPAGLGRTPPSPPVGGAGSARTAPEASMPPLVDALTRSLERASQPAGEASKAHEPPRPSAGPPRGAQAARKGTVRGVPVAHAHWPLWCHAWWLWRRFSVAVRKRQPPRLASDDRAMSAILARALLVARGDSTEAIVRLAWAFRCHVRETPQGLWLLARDWQRYGHPPTGFQVPGRPLEPREAMAAAGGRPPSTSAGSIADPPPIDSRLASRPLDPAIARLAARARAGGGR